MTKRFVLYQASPLDNVQAPKLYGVAVFDRATGAYEHGGLVPSELSPYVEALLQREVEDRQFLADSWALIADAQPDKFSDAGVTMTALQTAMLFRHTPEDEQARQQEIINSHWTEIQQAWESVKTPNGNTSPEAIGRFFNQVERLI